MPQEWIIWLTVVGTNIGATVGVYKYFNNRIARVYERLDQIKDNIAKEFVQTKMCDVMHAGTAANLTGLETRVNQRLDKLESKFDQLMTLINERLK